MVQQRQRHRVGGVARVQLSPGRLQVVAHRLPRQPQNLANLPIRQPARRQSQDFVLPR